MDRFYNRLGGRKQRLELTVEGNSRDLSMVVFYLATWIDQARVSSSAGASALERLGELLSLVGILRH